MGWHEQEITRRSMVTGLAAIAAAGTTLSSRALAKVSTDPWVTHSVASQTDGLRIVYHVAGKGPPLVVVHGGSTTAEAYKKFAGYLTDRYRVALVERRNYTISASRPSPITFQQEVGDVGAVMHALGERCFLFGHSAGALVSLYVARDRQSALRALALYEPPLSSGGPEVVPVRTQFEQLVASGKPDEALVFLYEHFVGLSDAAARSLIATRGAVLRPLLDGSRADIEALVTLDTKPDDWTSIKLPTLLLVGDQSVEHPLRDSVAELQAVWPNAHTETLVGQGHAAYAQAPQLLASDVGGFFSKH